jgi:hypothetical protein
MKRIELRGCFAKEPKIKARYCLNWAAANGTQRRGIASTAKFDDRHGDEKKITPVVAATTAATKLRRACFKTLSY